MKIEVFGPGCYRCQQVEGVVKKALSELNTTAEVEKVSDVAKMVEAGIMQTPVLRIDGKTKCSGRVPKIDEVKNWIAEAK